MTERPDSALVTEQRVSPNMEPRLGARRPDMLVLHYTGMESADRAVDWLCNAESRVSSHYLVHEDGRIVQMVPEAMRAWHAGVSSWRGETDVNSCSIGIEIHNPGHEFGYPDFSPAQMDALAALCRDIIDRHAILPSRVLAHSDVAPGRKRDPGEKFDWARLARAGIGVWVAPAPAGDDEGLGLGDEGRLIAALQHDLAAFGYGVDPTGTFGIATENAVRAFQLHFRPERIDGRADGSTRDTLARLLALTSSDDPIA
jgi:N-acetylmuramoyl-L-alanine amidase